MTRAPDQAPHRSRVRLGPWSLVRLQGDSMAPTFRCGDLLLVRRLRRGGTEPTPGDVVCVDHPAYGFIVKRIVETRQERGAPRFALAGDGVLSTPACDLGTVAPEAIIARVRWRLPRLPGTRAR